MPTNESAGALGPGAPAPIWQDMLFLDELRREIGGTTGGREAEEIEQGYKPSPRDPRWLTWLSLLLLALVIIGVALVLGPHMGI